MRAREAEAGPRDPYPTAAYDYDLPEGLIARYPAKRRDESRLLVLRRGGGAGERGADGRGEDGRDEGGTLEDRRFGDLPRLLAPGDALVLNDTRVLPARLRGRKPTGAEAEVFLLRPLEDDPRDSARRWKALVRPGGKLKPGREVVVAPDFRVAVEDSTDDGGRIVRLEGPGDPWDLVERHGETPIPPYLDRESEPLDRERYQTVYAEHTGSVAAPTAGLHFTQELLEALRARGVVEVRITLHVGVGTFRPVGTEWPSRHELHEEPYRVTPETAEALNEVRAAGGRIWAVGTTVARTLETVAGEDGRIRPGEGRTDLFIRPPYRFRALDGLLTNFHLPRSSLLMLVCALAGREFTLRAYRHAVREGYRFYSYGDAMLVA